MIKINLVTSNLSKVEEFKVVIGTKAEIAHIYMRYKELKSDAPEDIAKDSAKMLVNEMKIPVVVEDSGLFIEALNGFPGTCSAYIHKRIGLNGILKLMEDVKDRTAYYKSAVAYCEPDKEPVAFLGEEIGDIAESVRGSYGFGHDPIFIPQGSHKTYGEMENAGYLKKFRRLAIENLMDYLEKII